MDGKERDYNLNFKAFMWHSVFLGLSKNFMNTDTIIPALLVKAGGTNIELGILTALLIGLSPLTQLVFASLLSKYPKKKKFLLFGIYLRILALLSLSIVILFIEKLYGGAIIYIFIIMTVFSVSGSFSNISYTDILGKAVKQTKRKKFFSLRQVITSVGLLITSVIIKKLLVLFDFPKNYALLFFIAFILLAIASLGFVMIREPESDLSVKDKIPLGEFFKNIPGIIKKDKNLLYYLIIINLMGFIITFLPFMIIYAKEYYDLTAVFVGNIFLSKILGMTVSGIIFYYVLKTKNYKNILYLIIPLGSMIPVLSIVLIPYKILYTLLFFISGVFFSALTIAASGILMEISNEENRSVYVGISGAGKIVTLLFPLILGFVIALIGFTPVFIFISIVSFTAVFFIKKLECSNA